MPTTWTDADIDARRAWVAARREEGVEGVFRATAVALPLPPSFHDALRVARSERAVVAEVFRTDPGTGESWDIEPAARVGALEALGASAIAMHVDEDRRGSSHGDLLAAAQSTSLPILCRDLILDPVQIVMARAHGAAAVSLHAGVLSDRELKALFREALDLGLDVMLEVTSARELDHASRLRRGSSESAAVRIIAVDACGDPANWERLRPGIPEHAVAVATGVCTPEHLAAAEEAGFDAFFVGAPLLCPDPTDAAATWLGEPIGL